MKRIAIGSMGAIGSVHFLAARELLKRLPGWGLAFASSNLDVQAGLLGRARPNNLGILVPEKVDLTGVNVYGSFSALIADPEVELVVVASPSGEHRRQADDALKAGKHVLVEKPIAMTVEDAQAILAAAAAAGRQVFCGQILPWFPDFSTLAGVLVSLRGANGEATRLAVEGRYGRLQRLSLMRHVNRENPTTFPSNLATSGGPMLDLFVHDGHFVAMAVGRPVAVQATGEVRDGVVTAGSVRFFFHRFDAEVIEVVSDCGATLEGDEGFRHGFEAEFADAKMVYSSAGRPRQTLLNAGGVLDDAVEPDTRGALGAFTDQLAWAVKVIGDPGVNPLALSATAARDALEICFAAQRSIREGGVRIELAPIA